MTEDENRSPGFVYKSNYELRAVQQGDLRCWDSSFNSLLKKTREIRMTLDNFENLAFWALDPQQPKHSNKNVLLNVSKIHPVARGVFVALRKVFLILF